MPPRTRGQVMPRKDSAAPTALNLPPGQRAIRARMQHDRVPGLRVENSLSSRTADLWLYAELSPWGVTAEDFVEALQGCAGSDLVVHVNSPGGDFFDGAACYHALKNFAGNVEVRIEGLAASAASFIAMAGDTIVVEPASQVMIHEASGLCWGNGAEMTAMASVLDKISQSIAEIYQTRAGGTVEDWRAAMQAETWYSATEAVAAGLADVVAGQAPVEPNDEGPVEPASDEPSMKSATALAGWPTDAWDLSAFTYAGRDAAPAPKLPTAHAEAVEAPTEAPVEVPAAEEPQTSPEAVTEPVEPAPAAPEPESVETPSRTDAAGAQSPATDEDTWGALVASLTTATAPLDVIGDALASLREAIK